MNNYVVKYCGSIDVSSDYVKSNKELMGIAKSIKKLIEIGKDDFIPPLDYRNDSVGGETLKVSNLEYVGIEPYLEKVLRQKNIVVLTPEGEVVSFMSFRHEHDEKYYLSKIVGSGDVVNYVTTLITSPTHLGRGLAKCLYDYIENRLPKDARGTCVATRTWHTNVEHIGLIERRGYERVCTLHKQREWKCNETGNHEFYDTVYYCKRVEDAEKISMQLSVKEIMLVKDYRVSKREGK